MRFLRFVGRGFWVSLLLFLHGLTWLIGWIGLLLTAQGKLARQQWFATRMA